MTRPYNLRAVLAELGLSQLGAARLLGVEGRTIRRWIAEPETVPHLARLALDLLRRHPDELERLKDAA